MAVLVAGTVGIPTGVGENCRERGTDGLGPVDLAKRIAHGVDLPGPLLSHGRQGRRSGKRNSQQGGEERDTHRSSPVDFVRRD
jgi:hypothetical protein